MHLFLLGCLSPLFLFPSLQTIWIVFLFPLFWIFILISRGRLFGRTFFDIPIVILLLQVLATCFLVPDLAFSLPKITGVMFGVLTFYVLSALLVSKDLLKLGIFVYIFSGVIFAGFGILGVSWDYDSLVFSIARLFGINLTKTVFTRKIIPALESVIPRIKLDLPGAEEGFNGNAIGGALLLVIPLALVFFLSYLRRNRPTQHISQSKVVPWILVFALLIFTGVLFLSLSVVSWAALAISIWILVLSKKAKTVTAVVLAVCLIGIVIFMPKQVSSISDEIRADLDPEKIEHRLKWWGIGWETIKEYPVFGIGMNRIRLHPEIGYERSHLHNHFLHTATELGLPALLAYLSLLVVAGYLCIKVWRASSGWMKTAALGLGCGQLAHLLFGLIDSIPLGAKVGIFFWVSLSLIAALFHVHKEKSDPDVS